MSSNSPFLAPFLSLLLWGSAEAQTLQLSDAYALALKNEPKLAALALHVSANAEGVTQMRARLLPQIQGSLSWGRYEYDAEYLRKVVKESYTSYSLSATQPLYRPDIWRGIDQAKATHKGANYEYQAEAQKLGLDLTKAYFNLLRTQRNVELSNSQKEFYESKYRQLEGMLAFGLTNRIDLLESKVHRDKAHSEWLTEQKRFRVALKRLENMIGESINVSDLPLIDFSRIDLQKFTEKKEEWASKLSNNPTLKASLAQEEIALHEKVVREYQHHPKLELNLARKETYTEDTVSHKYDNQAILQLTIPIYQGGYVQSQVQEGQLLLDAAKKEVEHTEKETRLRFEELWAERELSVESIRVMKESEKSAELYVQSVEKGYSAGLKNIVDVLEAKSKLFEVKRDLIDTGYDMINNELGLLDVAGELNVETMASLESLLFL